MDVCEKQQLTSSNTVGQPPLSVTGHHANNCIQKSGSPRPNGVMMANNCNAILDQWKSQKQDSDEELIITLEEKNKIIKSLAVTCATLARMNKGRNGDVARGIGGTLVSPPLNVSDVTRYFGDVKYFPHLDKLLRIVRHGVHDTATTQTNLEMTLEYGNHSSISNHLQNYSEDLKRNKG